MNNQQNIINKIQIITNPQFIVVYLNQEVFLKQYYIKGKCKDYTFFLVVLILDRYGLINVCI